MTDIFTDFRRVLVGALDELAEAGAIPAGLDFARVAVELPRDPAHGDLSTNAAMVLAGAVKQNPMALAEKIAGALTGRELASGDYRGTGFSAEVARPGFINIRLDPAVWHAQLRAILEAGIAWGDSTVGQGEKVNVEFVSANPTGPMHVGHGRGAVFGDVLAALLVKAGFQAHREYYINDAGAQVDVLAHSLHLRYRELFGEAVGAIPKGLYPGDYLIDAARSLVARNGRVWLDKPESEWLAPLREFAVAEMMVLIRADLDMLGIGFDKFSSERQLVEEGAVDECLAFLDQAGLTYTGVLEPPKGKLPDDWEPRPQLLFRATQFGDEVDRPLKKSDGSWTYFASDIAYHRDKSTRGFANLIDVWGADHGGYVKRMQAAVTAVTGGGAALDIKLCQLVNLFDNGAPVRMSKRAGMFVTLREVVDEVGKDAFRFIMLTRKNDQTLDFDFAKVTEQSKDNPVFYVQYAHARAASVMRHAAEAFSGGDLTDRALMAAPLE
ncbi:MAG: arginine--tRNA ligase, partial [Stellaceae bacterium]